MDSLSIYLLLDYLYNEFAVTFILSVIGVSIREIVGNINEKRKIHIGRVMVSSLFSTVAMCALGDYVHFNFSLYALVCVIFGMWSIKIVSFVLTSRFANAVMKSVAKNAPGVASDIVKSAMEDEEDDPQKKMGQNKNPEKDSG